MRQRLFHLVAVQLEAKAMMTTSMPINLKLTDEGEGGRDEQGLSDALITALQGTEMR